MKNINTGLHYPIDLDHIPPNWIADYVGTFATDVQSGFACGAHNTDSKDIAHLRPMNVSREGKIDLSEIKYISAEYEFRRLSSGDVLFNNTNSPELIGKTAFVNASGDGLAFSNHMTRLRFNAAIDPRFAAIQLHYLWMMKYFLHGCVKHVNQASVSSRDMAHSIPLVVPPIPEQRRIVAKIEELFSELDEGVDSLKTARDQLKVYRQAVLKHAFEGKLTVQWREKKKRSPWKQPRFPNFCRTLHPGHGGGQNTIPIEAISSFGHKISKMTVSNSTMWRLYNYPLNPKA